MNAYNELLAEHAKEQQIVRDRNVERFNGLVDTYNKKKGVRIGDFIRLPYGIFVRVCHIWPDSLQTCSDGSFHLSGNYASYSGGLDSGVKVSDIVPTNETREGRVWIWKDGMSGANRGLDMMMNFRVFELKEGADTSGVPQVKNHEEAEFLKTAETVTQFNGNGQEYTQPIPRVLIKSDTPLNDHFIENLEKNTGLKFVPTWGGLTCQPTKSVQIVALLCTANFETKRYDNWQYKNTLVLTPIHN